MVDLGTLKGQLQSYGYAINASGQVTGVSGMTDSNRHPFIYTGIPGSGGAMFDLGGFGGTGWGYGINDSGQVVGVSRSADNSANRAFLYTGTPGAGGSMVDLGTLGGGYAIAYGINDNGQIVGASALAGDSSSHAFLYGGTPGNGGAMYDLGTLGGTNSQASAINASGQVVGQSRTATFPHAFLYGGTPGVDGHMADLGTLGGTQSFASGINDNGQVVGGSNVTGSAGTDGVVHAFLYVGTPGVNGHMIDLDAWLDANNPAEGAKWTLESAGGINDTGLITGYGYYYDGPGGLPDGNMAFLLDARALLVPEPPSFVLLGIGAAGLLLWRSISRRQRLNLRAILERPRPLLHSKASLHFSLILAAVVALGARAANAQTPTILFDFDGTHGANPYFGSLTLSGSTLYGTTVNGGTNNRGTIFSIPMTGGTPTTLFSFDETHGAFPYSGLTLSGSTLYGMTISGGLNPNAYGTIFSIPVTGGTPTTLFSFDSTHGASPTGSLTLSGSTLYGMAPLGGLNPNRYGTIFSIPVTGGTPTTLFDFDSTHGANPYYGSLTLSGSTLYGMTEYGGANHKGTIFSVPVTGGTPTTLFSLDDTHGINPTGNLTLSGSTLYGMTRAAGANGYGTIFSIPVTGGTPTTLFDFDNAHGANPLGDLTLSGSTLYGMTTLGGANNEGVVFSLAVPEPSTFALAALGGSLWLAGRTWRRGALGKSRLILSEAIASRGRTQRKEASML
jgi:uncharacterized repeat protein (TIGR03803 family)/probable HAF family extracellular repeat protein